MSKFINKKVNKIKISFELKKNIIYCCKNIKVSRISNLKTIIHLLDQLTDL